MNSHSGTINITLQIYYGSLEVINGIRFTPREIDIIACVLNGRSAKTIPSLLAISAKTVATHLANIRAKTGRPSRESIISFVEKSGKLSLLKNDYYSCLLAQVFFENQIKGISKQGDSLSIVVGSDLNTQKVYVDKLKYHLDLSGFNTQIVVERTREHTVIYAEGKVRQVQVHSSDLESYYAYFYSVLEKFLPLTDVQKMVEDFKDYLKCIEVPSPTEYREDKPVVRQKSRQGLVIGLSLFCFLLSAAFIWNRPAPLENQIRSDLILPSEMTLVNRSELIARINDEFKSQKGIGSVAIVGIGGAGKTTLARNYAKQFKSDVMWEINAETQESLLRSFESLAYALASSEEDKKTLSSLQEIKDPSEKRDKIIFFVREKLRAHPNWFLIYDNVESYKDIEMYYPHDSSLWGAGKVLITTRNSTIQNNSPVGSALQIGELSHAQKLELFQQIMKQGDSIKFNKQEAEEFLREIPPFPLDVSLAAYYIKSTNLPYNKYMEHLNKDEEGFSSLQENILNESGSYNKTRYKIIALTLKSLIAENKSFRDLFLLIGLMDSQNIPKELLNRLKGDQKADRFIFNLKKYSLISEGTLSTLEDPTFSIHRSTQKIILDYLTPATTPQAIDAIARALDDVTTEAMDQEKFEKAKRLVSHCEKALERDDLIKGDSWVRIGKELGRIYYYIGNYYKALVTLERCQSIIREDNVLSNAILSAYVQHYLGTVYNETDEFEKAETSLTQSYDLSRKIKGDDHFLVALNLQHLGVVHLYKGKYATAKKLFEDSYQKLKDNYPDKYLQIARMMTRIGNVDRELGNYKEAIEILEKTLALYKKHLKADHYRIGQVLVRMAFVYRDMGNFQKAKQYLEEGLVIYQKYFPTSCDKVAWVTGKLGQVENELGNSTVARNMLESSLQIYTTLYPDDFELAWVKAHLGRVYMDLGLYEEAKKMLEEGLSGNEDNYGRDHKDTAQIIRDLGELYCLQGDFVKGEELLQRSLKIYQASNHPQTYMSLETLGEVYVNKSKQAITSEEAQSLKNIAASYYKQALKIIETRFPADSPHKGRIQAALKKLES